MRVTLLQNHRFVMARRISNLLLVFICEWANGAGPEFAREIRPVLSNACYPCHGPDAKARKAKLRLDERTAALESGVLSNGEMLRRITSSDPNERMPPTDSNQQLHDTDRAKLVQWLRAGTSWSNDDQHWAFAPPKRPRLPKVRDAGWPHNGIDHFVLAELERGKLKPTPEANKSTLLRRVTIDLTGLPPTLEELDAFIADDSQNAYAKTVDRLLDSQRYGEHMALGWMEASRYADTDGYQNDRLRYMWVWRDWLIQAINNNMPFDRFVTEQMAGDLLPDRDFFTQVATGFNRNHRINSEAGSIPSEWIVEYVADRVETMGTMFLGITLNCSRCHDHKYDPVSQDDFYGLFAFFNNIDEAGLGPNNGNSPPFIRVPKSWPNLSELEAEFVIPEPMKIKVVQTSVPRPQPGATNTVMVLHELAKPRATYRLERGLYDRPDMSKKLHPATPPLLGKWNEKWPRNRLGLARWLLDPAHPLTARVTVNRMWQHHFGLGLVKTSENFGMKGERPSHPKLLDWLATEFMRHDWNLKAMHRLIVTSATYRQSSRIIHTGDPENRLLARGPRKRLTPFAIRDAALFSSGLLNEKLGGPPVKPYMPPGIWRSVSNAKYEQDKGGKLYRRSLYTYWRRTLPPPTMTAFNAAARETCIVRNDLTTTPLQALTMMNNKTFVEVARFLGERMMKPKGQPKRQRVANAFRRLTSRVPLTVEIDLLMKDLEAYQSDFRKNPKAAMKLLSVGEKPRDPSLPPAQLAAFTLVASTILNLDEVIMQN